MQLRLLYQSEDIKHRDRVSKMGTIPVIMIIIDFLVVREMARKVFCRMNLSWVVYIQNIFLRLANIGIDTSVSVKDLFNNFPSFLSLMLLVTVLHCIHIPRGLL